MSDLAQTSCACAPIVLHMHKKFELNWTKIKGGCQSCRKVVAHDSRSDLPLVVGPADIKSKTQQVSLKFRGSRVTVGEIDFGHGLASLLLLPVEKIILRS